MMVVENRWLEQKENIYLMVLFVLWKNFVVVMEWGNV